ncbi:MAG: AAA family ATPase [Rhodospirillaceae bacterium]
MTDPLFLESVTLENYRSFRALTLPIAPGPSVLVVAGPNGLGKTSLIEGIEWALTGRLRRYSDRRQKDAVDALQRRVDGQIVTPLSVRLGFTDGTTIKRSHPDFLEYDGDVGDWPFESEGDVAARVGAFLKAEGWTHPIDDLSAYLGLTHFLSQSPTLRLTARSGEQRWKDLSGLTGAIRIDRILANLTPAKRAQATKRINALREQQRGVEQRKDQLLGLLLQVKEQEALLRAGDSIAPEQVLAEVEAQRQRLWGPVALQPASSGDPAEELAALRGVLRIAEVGVDERREALENASPLPEQWHALKCVHEQLEKDLAAVQALEELFATAQEMASKVQQLEKRQMLLSRLPGLKQDADNGEKALAQAMLALKGAQTEEGRLRSEYHNYVELCEKVRTEEDIVDGWRALGEQEKRVQGGLEAVRREESERRELQQVHDRAVNQVNEADERFRKADTAVAVAENKSAIIAAAISEKLGHLQALLALLQDEDTECPLCLTRHATEPGWVLEKAREAVERCDPALKEANERLAEAQRLREDAERLIAECHQAATVARDALHPFLQREREATEAVDTLRGDPRLGGRPLEGLVGWLAEKLKEADERLAEARRARDALNPHQDLADRLDRAAGDVRLKVQERDEGEACLRTQKAAVEDCVSDLEENAATVGSLELPETAEALALARRSHHGAAEKVDAAAAALRPDLRPSEGKQPVDVAADIVNRLGETGVKRTTMADAWRACGLEGEPDNAAIAAQQAKNDAAKVEIAAIAKACARLHDGLTAWYQDTHLQDLNRQISGFVAESGASDSQSCLSALTDDVGRVSADIERWGRAQKLMGDVCQRVETEQDAFFTQIIQPLQEQVTTIDRAWSSFPDLQAELQAARVNGRPNLTVQAGGIDAEFRLSEGQAGAKALSFLLAASTAHPWSRWKALLLDDPLQYNDLVHKAAFLDMLRPLVREQRYQVVMSTHDLEEADFIGRKCRNASIAFSLCRLISLERGGVKVAIS